MKTKNVDQKIKDRYKPAKKGKVERNKKSASMHDLGEKPSIEKVEPVSLSNLEDNK